MDANPAAPNFTLPTDQGTDFHLADYRGRLSLFTSTRKTPRRAAPNKPLLLEIIKPRSKTPTLSF